MNRSSINPGIHHLKVPSSGLIEISLTVPLTRNTDSEISYTDC